MADFTFQLQAQKGTARAGKLFTPHGEVLTPIFMPVGTLATIKSLDTQDIFKTQAQIILANTYHLYLRPGMQTLLAAGGIHAFMGWDKPILTDSGGFQVFSLGAQMRQNGAEQLARIGDDGVGFRSHIDGSDHFFTPEKAIEIQRQIGADIIMAFDECTPTNVSAQAAGISVERTRLWAERCISHWHKHGRTSQYGKYQALFGIVQGGVYPELRKLALQHIQGMPFDGIAFGGESIGYDMQITVEVMNWVREMLPENMPRYGMGLGRDPQDIVSAVLAGYDMFDCVSPTRLARNGALYFGEIDFESKKSSGEIEPHFISPFNKGRLQIGRAEFSRDQAVIQPGCDCATCTAGYSRSYLHHLHKTKELTYYRLASVHNIRFFIRLVEQLRNFILG